MKKNRYLFLLLALLLVGLLAVGCGGTKETPQGDTIKIGFLGAKTGGHAHYGIETLKGMQMAVEDINSAGGVNGKKLEIVEGDHGSSSSEAANVTQKLITQKVSAIVGDPTTGITKAAAQIASLPRLCSSRQELWDRMLLKLVIIFTGIPCWTPWLLRL